MPEYTHLRAFPEVMEALPTEVLQENIIAFLNWGLLEAGGSIDVPVRTPGSDDPNADERLFPVHQQGVTDGRIWQAVHTDWVWETNLESVPQPIRPTGVYINGTLVPFGSLSTPFYVNFPSGQVVFDSPIPLTSVVQAAYSWRWVSLYGQQVPWFRQVVFDSLLIATQDLDEDGNVIIKLLDKYRVQPPFVIVEPVMTRKMTGYELGNGVHWVEQDFLFHIVAETAFDRNGIADVIMHQQDKTFYIYDVKAKREADTFSLNWRGEMSDSVKMYPQLVDTVANGGYRKTSAYFSKMVGQDITLRMPLYRGVVRATLRFLV